MFAAIGTLTALFTLITNSAHAAWDLNDVSYLFPLPLASDGANFLLEPAENGYYGELIPASLNPLLHPQAGDRDYYTFSLKDYRAVGVRIDPCFKMKPDEELCHKQIRIIWQPLDKIGTNNVQTYDGALHSFYDLTETEFSTLLNQLQALKALSSTTGKPLGVHPAFLSAATRAKFATRLKSTILSHVGASHLVRVTAINRPNASQWWQLFGFDFVGGFTSAENPTPITIPRTRTFMQDLFNEQYYADQFDLRGAFTPKLVRDAPDDITKALEHYDSGLQNLKEYYRETLNSIARIENPKVYNPSTMDCVHCHTTMMSQGWMKHNRPEVFASRPIDFRYDIQSKSSFNLENISKPQDQTNHTRAFGYVGNVPMVNNRVIFESAEIAKALNAR